MPEPLFMPKNKRFGRHIQHFSEMRKGLHKKLIQTKLFDSEPDNIQDNAWLFTQT